MKNRLLQTLAVLVIAIGFIGATTRLSGPFLVETYGAGTTCATATGEGDLCTADAIEANGALDIAGASTLTGAVALGAGLTMVDDADFVLGTGSDFLITFDTTQAPDSAFIGVGSESRQLVIGETADVGTDLTIAQQTNPTINLHSADATTASDYLTIAHNATDGVITIGDGDLVVEPTGADLVIGAGTAGVDYALKVNGADSDLAMTYMEDELQLRIDQNVAVYADDKQFCMGAAGESCFEYDTAQTADALVIGVSTESEAIIITQLADMSTNYGHADQANPTLYMHSSTAAHTSDYLSIAHDDTDGVLAVGSGDLVVSPAGADLVIGTGGDVDHALKFNANTADASLTWMEDESILRSDQSVAIYATDKTLCLGGTAATKEACLEYDSTNVPDTLVLGLGEESNALLITTLDNISVNYAHPLQANPTTYWHAATAAHTTEWISIANDDTNGVIATGAGDIVLEPVGADVVVGAGTAGVDYAIKVNGENSDLSMLWMEDESQLRIDDDVAIYADDKQFCLGGAAESCLEYDSAQTNDALMIGVTAESESVIIGQLADISTDFGHGDMGQPTLFVHSSDAANTKDWISISHDDNNAVIGWGDGNLAITGYTLGNNDASNTDAGIALTQTLNDTIGAAGVENYTAIKATITETSKAGWNTVDLMNLIVGATSQFKISDGGVVTLAGGAGVLTTSSADATMLVNNNDATAFSIGSSGDTDLLTIDTTTDQETVIVDGHTAVLAFNVTEGTSQFDEDVAFNGAAGAINTSASGDSSVIVTDNDSTALVIGSTGRLNLITLDTTNTAEGVLYFGESERAAAYTISFTMGAGLGLSKQTHDGLAGVATADVINDLYYGKRQLKIVNSVDGDADQAIAAEATGLDIADAAGDDDDVMEIFGGIGGATGRPLIPGVDPAFKFCATLTLPNADEISDALYCGFRIFSPPTDVVDDYTTYSAIGIGADGGDTGTIYINDDVSDGDSSGDTWADGASKELCTLVGADRAVTHTIAGAAPTTPKVYSFPANVPVIPFCYKKQTAVDGEGTLITKWAVTFQ